MIENRYEEYLSFVDNIPFVLKSKIERTASIYTKESNWHENLEIQLCVCGEGEVLIDGMKSAFRKDDIAIINSNAIHHTGTHQRIVYTCLIIDTEFCKSADIDISSIKFKELINDAEVKDLILDIEQIFFNINDSCRVAKLRMLTLSLLIKLKEGYVLQELAQTQSNISFENVKGVIKFVRANYMHKLSLDDISSSVYANKFVLSRQFKKVTRQSIIEYLNSYRCTQAKLLIQNGLSVSEAARECGFTNMSFFTKTFREYFGKMPSQYKRSQLKK